MYIWKVRFFRHFKVKFNYGFRMCHLKAAHPHKIGILNIHNFGKKYSYGFIFLMK